MKGIGPIASIFLAFFIGAFSLFAAAADPLEGIDIAAELNEPPYDRNRYKHWIENDDPVDDPVDEDCQNVRHEVLIRESLAPVTFTNDRECTVKTGYWYDPYTCKTFTKASDVDIDHFVPLKEAHVSGGALVGRPEATGLRKLPQRPATPHCRR